MWCIFRPAGFHRSGQESLTAFSGAVQPGSPQLQRGSHIQSDTVQSLPEQLCICSSPSADTSLCLSRVQRSHRTVSHCCLRHMPSALPQQTRTPQTTGAQEHLVWLLFGKHWALCLCWCRLKYCRQRGHLAHDLQIKTRRVNVFVNKNWWCLPQGIATPPWAWTAARSSTLDLCWDCTLFRDLYHMMWIYDLPSKCFEKKNQNYVYMYVTCTGTSSIK